MKNLANVESPRDHPAARNWKHLGFGGHVESLQVLQDESIRSVFRLQISEPPHGKQESSDHKFAATGIPNAVIAKRAPSADVGKELLFYQTLHRLPIPALRSFGIVADDDPEYGWLYMTDAGDRHYDPGRQEHRRLVAAWLARMHSVSCQSGRPAGLDDRGPKYFFPYVIKALSTLENHRKNPLIGADDHLALDDIREFCRKLESNWNEIARFCDSMPHTLVHGDIKEDNMRIYGPENQPSLVVFDWHEGGWGAPALDLAKFLGYRIAPDFDTYLQHWLDFRPQSDIGEVRRLGYIGEIFRWIASVRWHLDALEYGCIERAMSRMNVYRDWMIDIDRAAPWRSNPELAAANWQPLEKYWS
jgi:hypothetical protein